IDFSAYNLGTQVILKNAAGTGSLSTVMRFDVEMPAVDDSDVPDCLSAWEDLPIDEQTPTREFVLNRRSSPEGTVWTINNEVYEMTNPPLAQVKHGALERWKFLNPTNHQHPVHIHLIQFQVLDINGVAQDPSRHGWKDVLLAPPGGEITVAARFKCYTGR